MAPDTMTEGPRLPSLGGMHASISLCTTITGKQPEESVITDDTVPTLSKVPPPVRSYKRTAASPDIQKSQSGKPGRTPRPKTSSQKPVYNAPTDNLFGESSPRADLEPR